MALRTFIQTCLFIPPVLVLPVVWLDIDPLRILSHVLVFHCSNFVMISVRIILQTVIAFEVLKSLCCLATFALLLLSGTNNIIARARKVLGESPNISPARVIKIYKELQIWNGYYNNQFCDFIVPPLIFFGMCIIIFVNYVTIKLPGSIPLALYWTYPLTSTVGICIVVTLLPQGASIWGGSLSFVRFLKGNCYSKYEVRLARSLTNVAINVGRFGKLQKSWNTSIVWNILNYTINLLLTFQR